MVFMFSGGECSFPKSSYFHILKLGLVNGHMEGYREIFGIANEEHVWLISNDWAYNLVSILLV